MTRLKVMVIDDSLVAARKLETILADMGHQVVKTVASGAAALEAYRQCTPDLVTMDITMPDMDGIQATRGIVSAFPDARIIMVTSHGQEGMVREALKAGAKGYVLKPVKVEKLLAMIKMVFVH
ncbi:MAG TPA: response regulator [Telmatospirillum sp.]|nr:response regulator [Telmatospirillum sp.]